MSSALEDWVVIVPAKGTVKATVRELLAAARTPADVRTQGNGDEFLVAPYVAEALNPPKRQRKPRQPKEGA